MDYLFPLFGTPSPQIFALKRLMNEVMTVVLGEPTVAHVNDIEEMRQLWAATKSADGRRILLVSDAPHQNLQKLFRGANLKLVVSVERFEALVGFLKFQGLDIYWAIRRASLLFSALNELSGSNFALLVNDGWLRRDVMRVCQDICEHLGIEISEAQRQQILANLGLAAETSLQDFAIRETSGGDVSMARAHGLSASELNMLKPMLPRYNAILNGAPIQEVVWNTECFFYLNQTTQYQGHAIDMIGPARYLVYGPYMHLPAGVWEAELSFTISENHSQNNIAVDAHVALNGEFFSNPRLEFDLPVDGTYSLKIKFEVPDFRVYNDIRISLVRGAIEGQFVLHSVVLRLMQDPRMQI